MEDDRAGEPLVLSLLERAVSRDDSACFLVPGSQNKARERQTAVGDFMSDLLEALLRLERSGIWTLYLACWHCLT